MELIKKYGLTALFVGIIFVQVGWFPTKEEMRAYAEQNYVPQCQFKVIIEAQNKQYEAQDKELKYIRNRVDGIYEKLK